MILGDVRWFGMTIKKQLDMTIFWVTVGVASHSSTTMLKIPQQLEVENRLYNFSHHFLGCLHEGFNDPLLDSHGKEDQSEIS
jgi:hypothetical protein